MLFAGSENQYAISHIPRIEPQVDVAVSYTSDGDIWGGAARGINKQFK